MVHQWTVGDPQQLTFEVKIAYYVLGGVFGVLALANVVQVIRGLRRTDKSAILPQILFSIFMSVGSICRSLYFILVTFLDLVPATFSLSVVPGVIFFTTYLILTGTWMNEVTTFASQQRPTEAIWTYVVANLFIYAVFIGLGVSTVVFWGTTLGEKLLITTLIVDGALNMVTGVVVMTLGGYRYCKMRSIPVTNQIANKKIRSMGWMVLFCTLVLVIRASLIIVSAFVEFDFSPLWYIVFECSFYSLLEVAPTIIMMIALAVANPVRPLRQVAAPVLVAAKASNAKKDAMAAAAQRRSSMGLSPGPATGYERMGP